MPAVVLLAIDQAVSPSDAIEALSTLQIMLIGDAQAQVGRKTRSVEFTLNIYLIVFIQYYNYLFQVDFAMADGYNNVAAMLRRVEDNLVLLVPCRDSSLAAASGISLASQTHSNDSSNSNNNSNNGSPIKLGQHQYYQQQQQQQQAQQQSSPHHLHHHVHHHHHHHHPGLDASFHGGKHQQQQSQSFSSTPSSSQSNSTITAPGNCINMGLYYSFAKAEFDNYYSYLVGVLINLLIDDIINCGTTQSAFSVSNNSNSSNNNNASALPVLPPKGSEIRNLAASSLLMQLTNSGSVSLHVVALRVCFALLKVHANNAIALESVGVMSAFMESLLTAVLTKSLDKTLLVHLFSNSSSSLSYRNNNTANQDLHLTASRLDSGYSSDGINLDYNIGNSQRTSYSDDDAKIELGAADYYSPSYSSISSSGITGGRVESATTTAPATVVATTTAATTTTVPSSSSSSCSEHYSSESMAAVVSDIIVVLQMMSVVTSIREATTATSSMATFLTILVFHISTCLNKDLLHCQENNSISNNTTGSRCQNCEVEASCLQCLNDG